MVLEININKFSCILKIMSRNTFPELQPDSASYVVQGPKIKVLGLIVVIGWVFKNKTKNKNQCMIYTQEALDIQNLVAWKGRKFTVDVYVVNWMVASLAGKQTQCQLNFLNLVKCQWQTGKCTVGPVKSPCSPWNQW